MKIGKKFTSIRPLTWGVTAICLLLLAACSVSYKFNGASIDYSKVRTIQIADFPIRSTYVWGPMGPMFNNQLKDVFANHTRLHKQNFPSLSMCASQTIQTIAKTLNDSSQLLQAMKLYVV